MFHCSKPGFAVSVLSLYRRTSLILQAANNNISVDTGTVQNMPRARDIGWQHGKMIGEHRHHVECNYCHRTMIGGVTRFKKHLASTRGEIKGCDAVPKEVKELIEKHLAAGRMRKTAGKKQKKADVLKEQISEEKGTESDEPNGELPGATQEILQKLHEDEEIHEPKKNDHQQPMVETRELFDSVSIVPCKNEQVSTPPRATDLGWAHGTMVNGDRQKIKCRYCHKIILGGGISRLKQHLAGERGNIAPCENVPEDVKCQMQQHIGSKALERLKKKKKKVETVTDPSSLSSMVEMKSDYVHLNTKSARKRTNHGRIKGKEVNERTFCRRKRPRKQLISIATPITQRPMHLKFASQESIDQADKAVAKFMYDAGIPFCAANSMHFQLMADAIAAVGPGYKMPSYHSLRGDLLNKSLQEAGQLCDGVKKSWEVTGCSVMADSWRDRTGRTIVDFLVYCSKGTIFLKSVDATDISKSSVALLDLFDSIVQEVGPKNIVHFVTDTAPNYKAAGKMLMARYKTFFWSACAAHCIDLMLEELGKMNEVKQVLDKAKRICQLIYNHTWALNLLRERSGGKDLVKHGITRSTTDFLTLQCMNSLKEPLHQIFTSTTWTQSALSKLRAGLEVTETVLDPLFWLSCTNILKVGTPLLAVLHLADSEEKSSMGYIYDAMETAKKDIVVAFHNKESDYLPYLNVINHIWEEELHSPLHAAGFYLNPVIFYNPSFLNNKVIQKGLLDCIEGLEPDSTSQDMITRHINFYENAMGNFSRPVAIQNRDAMAPATWWSSYAADYPHLQRFAIRILSQTCSIVHSERNSSMFEGVNSKKNLLEQKRLKDIIFVHYNLRLQARQSAMRKTSLRGTHDPTCLEGMDHDAGDWVEDPGTLEEEAEEHRGWMDLTVPRDAIPVNNKIEESVDGYSSDGTKSDHLSP